MFGRSFLKNDQGYKKSEPGQPGRIFKAGFPLAVRRGTCLHSITIIHTHAHSSRGLRDLFILIQSTFINPTGLLFQAWEQIEIISPKNCIY